MYEIKVNLVIALPGRDMMSEQECFKKVRKPLVKDGKKILKNGKPIWITDTESVVDNTKSFQLKLKEEVFNISVRKAKPALQVLNLSKECYKHMISYDIPENFRTPKNFQAPTIVINGKEKPKYPGVALNLQAWMELGNIGRLNWHLKEIAQSLGGTVQSFKVFAD